MTSTVTVTFDGATCRHDAPATIAPGVVRVVFVNMADADALADSIRKAWTQKSSPAKRPSVSNPGLLRLVDGKI